MLLANETEERKAKIWKTLSDQTKARYSKDNGHVELDNEAVCIVGKKRD
jgi:hypothetical protein